MILQLPSNLPSDLQGVKIVDIRHLLPVNPNYSWEQLKGNRDVLALTTQVFHHDAIPKAKSMKYGDVELAQRIATDHIRSTKNRSTGDPGFPYDAWIRNGIIYICNDILPLKYGVPSNNTYTVHICVSGDYKNFDTLTDGDRKALYAAHFLYKSMMPNYKNVLGHGEITPTQCPGFDMNKVRADLTSIIEQIQYNESPNRAREEIFASVTRVNDLYAKYINKDGKYSEAIQKEAERKLSKVHPMLKAEGFI